MASVASASRTARAAVAVGVGWVLVGVGWVLMFTQAAAPAKAGSLARFFPREDLVVYAEFDGVDAHAAAWKRTAAYRLLNETTTGAMLETIVTQLADRAAAASGGDGRAMGGKELVALVEHAFRSGFAFGINKAAGARPTCVGLVLRGAGKGEARVLVMKLLQAGNAPATTTRDVGHPGGRTLHVVGEPQGASFAWWAEGDDLALSLVSPQGADAMIEALDGRRPDATGNPRRAELAAAGHGFEPIGLAFLEMAALPPLPLQAVALGLGNVRRVEYRWGVQDDALMTITRIVAPAPRAGVLAALDQPMFAARDLPPLPDGLTGFTVFSLAPGAFYDRMREATRAGDPNAPAHFDALEQSVLRATGHRLREEILKPLGPRMVFYVVPDRINAPTNAVAGLAQGLLHVAKATLVVEVEDGDAYARMLDDLAARANEALRTQPNGARLEPLRTKGGPRGYVLSVPPSAAPIPAGMRPTILLGKKTLVIGTTPDAARRALALEGKPGYVAGGPLAEALDHLPPKLTFLNVSDTRETMLPDVIANLPTLIQVAGGGPLRTLQGFSPDQLFRRRPVPPPAPGATAPGFALEIDPDLIPSPDDLRAFLFPATFAVALDDQGIQLLSREAFPAFNPTTAAPLAMALLLPAVQASREAARRAQSVNNLKQIGLAMHNFLSVQNHFPGPIRDKDGKPVLSWRVAILPFLEQQALFNEFKQDEPWDSPHNKALLERMPDVFAVPGARAEPGLTFYRGFSGKSTLFDETNKAGVGIATVTDGTSNTLGAVEAKEAVPWTKPDSDIPFDPDMRAAEDPKLLAQMGEHFSGGFNALFLDGSVHFIKKTVSPAVLRALITRDRGEVVSSDSF
jgi:prepilin-type processing-associated H-X9-DG protein